jgi:hypothetical protein
MPGEIAVSQSEAGQSPAITTSLAISEPIEIEPYFDPYEGEEPGMSSSRGRDHYSMNRVLRDLRRRKTSLTKALAEANAGLDLLERDPHALEAYRIIQEAF